MPISLEPNKRFAVVLDGDADKPMHERPIFYVHSQTMRGHLSILEALDRWSDPEVTPATLFEATIKELERVIVGWSCMGSYVFGQTDLRELLSYDEARQILRKVAYNMHLTSDEKKSSE
jgi:hypothetical protein